MKQFACGSVVSGCDGVVTGETEDDVMAAAVEHARTAHGMDDVPEELAGKIRAGITDA